ncbi:MAG: response regulator transcription factor [Bacteroidetes bacterium]|nr:response regulator transcription factor [Bacteroidota bacterium]
MEKLLKILIVDDKPEARELLEFILQEEDGLKVVGLAGGVDEALELLKQEGPDLVLLDIQMPDKDGFHFIEQVKQSGIETGIIFVTAFDHYAIQAIRNSVFDYIMKPIMQKELFEAIDRFRNRDGKREKQNLSELLEVLKGYGTGKMKLNTRSGYILINPSEVVYCKADGNYTHLQLESGSSEITTQNLGAIEELLVSAAFFRVSRSYLVNLKFLARVDRKSSLCILEYNSDSYSIKIPSQKIRMLEASLS